MGWDGTKFAHNFIELDSRVVFLNLYGSVFGPWDQEDDFLRAPLANPYDPLNGRYGYGLTSVYGHWLGLDETSLTKRALRACIGDALLKGYAAPAHYALMGDPTLRMHSVQPPEGLVIATSAATATLTWTASADPAVSGYNIYCAPTEAGP